uniref:Retrotransposon gag protein n=1 Tax=Solanum tuberosum TaxID=4113 RepID=M1DKR4_SOLTU
MSVVNDYEPIEHLSVEMMRFRASILTFKKMQGELFHESWLRFKALLIQCPTHEIPDLALLECFYRSLNPGNRGLIDRLIPSGLERYSTETAAKFLDLMTKTNKDTEKDHQLIILLVQMDNLTHKVEELEVMSKKKSKCIPPTEQGRSMDNENRRIEDMLLTNLQKLNEQDRVLEEIRENVKVLNQMSGSHSRSIYLIETLLGHVLPQLHRNEQLGSPSCTRFNPKNKV